MSTSSISVAVTKLRTASIGNGVTQEEKTKVKEVCDKSRGMSIHIDLCNFSKELLSNLLKEELSANQRRMIVLFTMGDKASIIDSVELSSPKQVHNALAGITEKAHDCPNAEFLLNGRWYPIVLQSQLQNDMMFGSYCSISGQYMIGDIQDQMSWYISDKHFVNDDGHEVVFTLRQLMDKLGIRPVQQDLREYFLKVKRAERLADETGKVYDVTNSVLFKPEHNFWNKITELDFGSPVAPKKVVIESELETQSHQQRYMRHNEAVIPLPFVRCFSLEMKKYVYVDIEDLAEYEFDTEAITRLVLPSNLQKILTTVFTAEGKLFADVVKGKHGGMVILANGPAGVGKTLTAEVFAEHTKKPLYVMEMGELGTSLQEVEKNLQRVFLRAARWKAVLLFDEADVFMAKRDNNLERSAIVGVFLRLLDYYHGLLFLTTNRIDVIDQAFKSRITLKLDYPELNRESRLKIWENMLKLAGMKFKIGDDFDGIPDVALNGRQIRNMVRLLRVIHPSGLVSSEEVKEVCKFSCS